ncbi:heme exporter protein D [Marinobacter daqiaonensis]|uniref:Heme exporter protein D n=1 Tax=Marinobacter daqiaonensis TaxID=650891 RepID=A0A1I6H5V1_9GAMM|nr:heme exporter protein CcmD [Marinobacter daqiaonensis]SFR49762.1 heme exporter protein D [Marinobacter daqiaonensis]
MAFDSLNALIVMEGHGPYVWTCYGVFFLLLGVLVWWSLRERRQLVREQKQLQQQKTEASPLQAGSTAGSFQRINTSRQ